MHWHVQEAGRQGEEKSGHRVGWHAREADTEGMWEEVKERAERCGCWQVMEVGRMGIHCAGLSCESEAGGAKRCSISMAGQGCKSKGQIGSLVQPLSVIM